MLRPLLLLLLVAGGLPAQVAISEGPHRGRLYPRDLVTDQASVPVVGEVTASGYDRVHLLVTRDGALWSSHASDLVYAGPTAPFAFTPVIDAGLHDYAFELLLESGGSSQRIHYIEWVLCGDALLVNGQSNAVARDYHNEGQANRSRSRWIRSFGSASTQLAEARDDLDWYRADGIDGNGPGTVGAWALRCAELLVDWNQVPVALINGGVGGTTIAQHQRDDADPENLNTIYGRLLYRARQAGLDGAARAMLWHQGESDGPTDPAVYQSSFASLRDDWLADYPALEHVFVFQVRKGCLIQNLPIREQQRQFPDLFADVTTVPTAGINAHDGCHFYYDGYRAMGSWMAAAVAARLYARPIPDISMPPNLLEARFTSAAKDEIELVFRSPRQWLVIDPGIEARFELDGGAVPETVTGATAGQGSILLQLSGPTTATEIGYLGKAGTGPWIKNQRGIGAFTFLVPIQP